MSSDPSIMLITISAFLIDEYQKSRKDTKKKVYMQEKCIFLGE